MIIYADIRPLIVTGIVLLFTNFGWNYPLPLKRKLQVPGKRMVMTKKSCQDPIGNKGTCMFKYDCIRHKGVTLSTCVDGFLFGACCQLKEDSIKITSDDIHPVSAHFIDFNKQNETTYNFYQINSNTSLNNSTQYTRPFEEIFNETFNIYSTENSSTHSPDIYYSTVPKLNTSIDLSDDVNNLPTVINVLKNKIYHNTPIIPSNSAAENFSLSSVLETTTSLPLPIDYIEESVVKNKSSLDASLSQPIFYFEESAINNKSSLDAHPENTMIINSRNSLPASLNPTESYPSPVDSSENLQIEEYRNQITSIHYFDDSSKENNTVDVIDYFIDRIEEETENSTALDRIISSDLNSTNTSVSPHKLFLQNIYVSTEIPLESNGTTSLTTDYFSLDRNNIRTESSEQTENYILSSFETNSSLISENYASEPYNIPNKSEYKNATASDHSFITESPPTTNVLSIFEIPFIQADSEYTNLQLTSMVPLDSPENSKLNESEKNELFETNTTSSNLDNVENPSMDQTTFHDKPSKLSNDSAAISNSKSSNSSMTSGEKRTTKAILPTLPWASNSILPASFQSVISQLFEQEISSPGNFISHDQKHATPAVGSNTMVDQNLFLDSEESVKLEFKSSNISGYLDDEYDKNIVFNELKQTSNSELDEAENFTNSPVGFNNHKLDDRNKNSLLIPNVIIKDLTNELNIKLTENLNTDLSLQDFSDKAPDEYFYKEISKSADFLQVSESEETDLSTSTSSLDLFTEQSNQHTKLLESNLSTYTDEILYSSKTVPYTFPSTSFQASNNHKNPNIHLTTMQNFDKNFSESSTSLPNVQIQLLEDLLNNATEFSANLSEESSTNSYSSVIQIINNHTGKNSSTIDFSNHKDTNDSDVSTVLAQSEETESEESSSIIYPVVNISLENSSNLYETEIFVNKITPIILSNEDFEERHKVDSSMHPVISTETLNSFNESLDSSQSTSSEIFSYTDFNSTNTLPSILIDNSTSPFTAIVHDRTKDTEFNLTDFEALDLILMDKESIENIGDSYNMIVTEDGHSTKFVNFSDEGLDSMKTNTKSKDNSILLNSGESSSDVPFSSRITTELDYSETSIFTTSNAETSVFVSNNAETSAFASSNAETSTFTTSNTETSAFTTNNAATFVPTTINDETSIFTTSNADTATFISSNDETSAFTTSSGETSVFTTNNAETSPFTTSNGETTVLTTSSAKISETVSTQMLPTLSDTSTLADIENPTLPASPKPTDLTSSDVPSTISVVETIPFSALTNPAFTQSLDSLTYGDAVSNTSHEYSAAQSTGVTPSSTTLTSESSSIQNEEIDNDDKLSSWSTKAFSTTVPTAATVQQFDIHRWNYKKDCGVRLMQPVGRIVGGKNTFFGKWPWQALVKEATWLGLFVKNKCGGVLITSKYVLTAAHCQPGFLASLLVVLGTHDLAETFDNKASIIRNVKRMVVHRHYNAQTFENDLALLEMEAPVEFLPYVVPICLPHRNEDFTGKMAFVTGWGKLTAGGDVPSILQEVQVPIVSNGECQSMFYQAGHHKAIRSNFVCAGYTNGGQDSCEGDSGGPLMVQREDTRWVLVGTVSHGIGCADPNLPGVYMRMSSYRPWIDSIIYK